MGQVLKNILVWTWKTYLSPSPSARFERYTTYELAQYGY
jgi:hypothetical protein